MMLNGTEIVKILKEVKYKDVYKVTHVPCGSCTVYGIRCEDILNDTDLAQAVVSHVYNCAYSYALNKLRECELLEDDMVLRGVPERGIIEVLLNNGLYLETYRMPTEEEIYSIRFVMSSNVEEEWGQFINREFSTSAKILMACANWTIGDRTRAQIKMVETIPVIMRNISLIAPLCGILDDMTSFIVSTDDMMQWWKYIVRMFQLEGGTMIYNSLYQCFKQADSMPLSDLNKYMNQNMHFPYPYTDDGSNVLRMTRIIAGTINANTLEPSDEVNDDDFVRYDHPLFKDTYFDDFYTKALVNNCALDKKGGINRYWYSNSETKMYWLRMLGESIKKLHKQIDVYVRILLHYDSLLYSASEWMKDVSKLASEKKADPDAFKSIAMSAMIRYMEIVDCFKKPVIWADGTGNKMTVSFTGTLKDEDLLHQYIELADQKIDDWVTTMNILINTSSQPDVHPLYRKHSETQIRAYIADCAAEARTKIHAYEKQLLVCLDSYLKESVAFSIDMAASAIDTINI